jgi:membrane fusion protein (multidrug efflux system)
VSSAAGSITTVSTLDPIKSEFTVSEQEYLGFMKNGSNLGSLQLELILADGTTYAHKGKFLFADRQVDPATGAIQLTGVFPNPGNTLRPGEYAKVRATTGVRAGAALIPQAAVTQLQGSYEVAVVDQNDRVAIRPVKAGERTGTMWLIEDGLKAGERVVVEGQQNLRPGTMVHAK